MERLYWFGAPGPLRRFRSRSAEIRYFMSLPLDRPLRWPQRLGPATTMPVDRDERAAETVVRHVPLPSGEASNTILPPAREKTKEVGPRMLKWSRPNLAVQSDAAKRSGYRETAGVFSIKQRSGDFKTAIALLEEPLRLG
jgi:hypothetical protein